MVFSNPKQISREMYLMFYIKILSVNPQLISISVDAF